MRYTRKNWTIKSIAGGLALLVASSSALAATDNTKTIGVLGIQGGQAYFSAVEGFGLNCQFGLIYLDITTDTGRAEFAELLVAKNSGRQLSRIDYTQVGGAGTQCFLSIVEVGN